MSSRNCLLRSRLSHNEPVMLVTDMVYPCKGCEHLRDRPLQHMLACAVSAQPWIRFKATQRRHMYMYSLGLRRQHTVLYERDGTVQLAGTAAQLGVSGAFSGTSSASSS